jgi:hypothetical protein
MTGGLRRGYFPAMEAETSRAPMQHAGLLSRVRKAAAQEGVGQRGGRGWLG